MIFGHIFLTGTCFFSIIIWQCGCAVLLSSPNVVLIRNKRSCKTHGGRVGTATPLCSLSVCLLYISLLLVSVAENYKAYASSRLAFTQPSSVWHLFFCPSSSSCMHCNAHVSTATPRFFVWHTWLPCWLWSSDLSIKRPFTHSPRAGGWQKCLCFPSMCMREKAQDAISGEREMKEPVIQYFPLWDFGLVSLFSRSVTYVTWIYPLCIFVVAWLSLIVSSLPQDS